MKNPNTPVNSLERSSDMMVENEEAQIWENDKCVSLPPKGIHVSRSPEAIRGIPGPHRHKRCVENLHGLVCARSSVMPHQWGSDGFEDGHDLRPR